MTSVAETTNFPVRKTINVNTSAERAFHVFTEGFDTWWPRSHSIGPSALQKAVIEGKSGGRCYQQSVDGSRMRLGPDPRVGAAATVRDRVAAECRVGVRARPREGERGRGQLHRRTGRVDARRSRTPPFRSPRRRRAADSRGSGFAGGLGRPAPDVRGRRGVAECSGRAGAGRADLQAQHRSDAVVARRPDRRRAVAAAHAAQQSAALGLRAHRRDAGDHARPARRSVRHGMGRFVHARRDAARVRRATRRATTSNASTAWSSIA